MTTLTTNLGPYTSEFGVSAAVGTAGAVGTILTIDTEDMAIVAGQGTRHPTVDRGANGTQKASHLSGAAVTVGTNTEAAGITLADLGVTASTTEVNLIHGSIAGTAVASAAAVLGANRNLDTLVLPVGGLYIGATAGISVTPSAAEINVLHSVSAGTVAASSAVVVDASKQVDTWTAVAANTSATLAGTTWAVEGQLTASNAAITAGTVWGVRGRIVVSGNPSAGYFYGNQGKAIVSGTVSGSANIYGVVAQLDISAGTYSAGVIAALWVDGGSSAASSMASIEYDLVRITQTALAATPNSLIYFEGQASHLFDFHSLGQADGWFSATALGGVTRKAKIKVKCEDGSDGYMSVYTD